MTWWIGEVDFSTKGDVQQDGRCVTVVMRKYLVRTDEPTRQNELQVALAVGIRRGSPIAFYPSATCVSAEVGPGPVMTKPPFQAFFATYTFSTAAPTPASETPDDDPTTMRVKWSISPQIQSRYIIKDKDGKLIVNTAGSPYDGGIPVDVRLGTVTAKRNKTAAGYDKDAVLANSGKVNKETFLGAPPGTLQADISAEEIYEGRYHYWAEVYTFCFDPLGIQPKPASVGFFQRRIADPNTLRRIKNRDVGDTDTTTMNREVQEPEPLDKDGYAVPIDRRPDDCAFVEVKYFEELDFDAAFQLT